MKKFIITIDTEGDNLWAWKPGNPIHTENTLFLQRFQDLANKYGFKPTWLTNYEMLQDDRYVRFIEKVLSDGTGELGMHLHAWNTPPDYSLEIAQNEASYLIEYPYEIMEAKIATMTELIKSKIGITPVSHRAGRWAMDERYFKLLAKYGYKVDCSVTPHINWKNSLGQTKNFGGADYSKYPEQPYIDKNGVLEVPVTIRKSHYFIQPEKYTFSKFAGSVCRSMQGNYLWLRPNGNNLNQMLHLLDIVKKSNDEYIMFMLHSSEMMPGGSPTFKDGKSIEKMYFDVENVFSVACGDYEGTCLADFVGENYYENRSTNIP